MNIQTSRIEALSPAKRKLLEQLLLKKKNNQEKVSPVLAARPIVPKIKQRDGLPLSFGQQRLWFLDELEPEHPQYNESRAVQLTGKFSYSVFDQAINEVLRCQQLFRTLFTADNGKPIQRIVKFRKLRVGVIDLQNLSLLHRKRLKSDLLKLAAIYPFHLRKPPLARCKLVRESPFEHCVIFSMHHIISDGWSAGIIINEVAKLYSANARGLMSPFRDLAIQYIDYTFWQKKWLSSKAYDSQLGFWKKELHEAPPLLDFPLDRPRTANRSFQGKKHYFSIPLDVVRGLQKISQQADASLFMTFLAAFLILLRRYSNQNDICIGTPIAGRNQSDWKDIIGFFINTLIMRHCFGANIPFKQFLAIVRDYALQAFGHQDIPLERLIDELQPKRSVLYSPLFQFMFVFQNFTHEIPVEIDNLVLKQQDIDMGISKFDLSFVLLIEDDSIEGQAIFNSDLLDAISIERFVDHFELVLKSLSLNDTLCIDALPSSHETVESHIYTEWNNTERAIHESKTLITFIEKQLRTKPHAIALVFEDIHVSFSELEQQSLLVAEHLLHAGIGSDTLVCLYLRRSLESLIAVLGIMRAGAAYVPIDIDDPMQRSQSILKDVQIPIIITHKDLCECDKVETSVKIAIEDLLNKPVSEQVLCVLQSKQLAYVIFTSGSTGIPKGVGVTHASLLNLWTSFNTSIYQDMQPPVSCHISLNGPLSFDTSIKQFVQLASGHSLFMVPLATRMDMHKLNSFVQELNIEVLDSTPSIFALLLKESLQNDLSVSALKKVLLGGEPVPADLWKILSQIKSQKFYNVYGPTECTVSVTNQQIQVERADVSVGRTIDNTCVMIANQAQEWSLASSLGHVHIGGRGVSRGYLNRANRTADRYLPDLAILSKPGARAYDTGDQGYWLRPGLIRLMGRDDEQVKIRGFRIELGEIENILANYSQVREVLILVKPDRFGKKQLVAYIVPKKEEAPGIEDLRKYIQMHLPDYMIPSTFVFIKTSFPLTSRGKIDKAKLPDPEGQPQVKAEYVLPRTPTEESLVSIWREVLKVDRIGVLDNFFDLGGNSLLSIQIISRIREEFGVDIEVRKIFNHQTIEELSVLVEDLLLECATEEDLEQIIS